ncbi:MAG: DUF1906 domain-containing protein [Lachnospiraceae bacterium]|nr:DUF1906 domain-containing protein [Lachnospiraceae bacterium]
MADNNVIKAQKYLNAMFGGHPAWVMLDEDGNTGTAVMEGILRAFQIQNNIPDITGTAGPYTIGVMKGLPVIKKMDPNDEGSINVCLIQCALFCKGYDAGGITGIYYNAGVQAVKEMQYDAGIPRTGEIDWKVWMGLLSLNWFQKSFTGDDVIRRIQRQLNSEWSDIVGVGPCDGILSRQTVLSLIGALQGAEGIATELIDNLNSVNFGDATTNAFPGRLKEGQNADEFLPYNKLVQYALYFNGYNPERVDGIYDAITSIEVAKFQRDYELYSLEGIYVGDVDVSTMKSLLMSKGDTSRRASACDCATVLNLQQAKDIAEAGYTHVGRYLTGYVGINHIPKYLTPEEIRNIEAAGLRVFPIYQDGGYYLEYFQNPARGILDAKMAILTAEILGFPEGTTIYFAVDFDCYEFQINRYIIPYFEEIQNFFSSAKNIMGYNVGIYAARQVCTKVSEKGYAKFSFVADMSWKYSCNLGFPIPPNWAFDQFFEEQFPSSPSFPIDKVAYSKRDEGTRTFDKKEQTPEQHAEYCRAKTEIARHKFIYDVLHPLNYWDKLINIGFSYNREIPLGSYMLGTVRVEVSVTFSSSTQTAAETDYCIGISVDETGKLTAGCKSQITEATKELNFVDLGNNLEIEEALESIALNIERGNITLGICPISSNKKMKAYIRVSTDNLAPDDAEIEQTMEIEIAFQFALDENGGDNFDAEAFATATILVFAGITVMALISFVSPAGSGILLNYLCTGGFLLLGT